MYKKLHMLPDNWHLRQNMRHLTPDPDLFVFGSKGVLKIKDWGSVTHLMDDKGVFKTDQATPGLIKIMEMKFWAYSIVSKLFVFFGANPRYRTVEDSDLCVCQSSFCATKRVGTELDGQALSAGKLSSSIFANILREKIILFSVILMLSVMFSCFYLSWAMVE